MYMCNPLYLTVWHDIDSDCTKTKLTESQLLGLSCFLVVPLYPAVISEVPEPNSLVLLALGGLMLLRRQRT